MLRTIATRSASYDATFRIDTGGHSAGARLQLPSASALPAPAITFLRDGRAEDTGFCEGRRLMTRERDSVRGVRRRPGRRAPVPSSFRAMRARAQSVCARARKAPGSASSPLRAIGNQRAALRLARCLARLLRAPLSLRQLPASELFPDKRRAFLWRGNVKP